ncbi:TM9 protein A [Cavenderia fasciculata]|uniref:Transmembrane 9 superfamily member n=1 Tax=Cavenderia fasciculata TaxID=261658 RepID=F4PWZ3_CACFS|nr:TM9 protein A [Cavenderia fasciculata]EGG19796.1 TM9 protein A [Cavenderia fasciculata]|eukprot:XP_004358142.1 TM9 protein A [Cavenderia fasciculata]
MYSSNHKSRILTSILVIVLSIALTTDAYLPGMQLHTYDDSESVPLKVNKITSKHTQIPYKYYDLPGICQPRDVRDDQENLGEILLGDRLENSLYQINFNEWKKDGASCKVLNYNMTDKCPPVIKGSALKDLSEKINNEYKVHWLLDGLPVRQSSDVNAGIPEPGYPLGYKGKDRISEGNEANKNYIYNHINIKVIYHKLAEEDTSYQIVGFEVTPESKAYAPDKWDETTRCPAPTGGRQSVSVTDASKDTEYILWTYSVTFEKSDVSWNKRWDSYLASGQNSIHLFSILNSLMIVFFLTVMVAMILMRTLKADFRRYNSIDASEEAEETGWKMIHGDVFRPPSRPMLLSVLVGSGVQVFTMCFTTMIFAILGFMSPGNIGGLATALIVLFVIMAMFAGYFSTRTFVTLKCRNWKKNTVYTAFALPGVVFGIFFIINMCLRGAHSSAAVPVSTLFSLIAMWFGISVPLVFAGSYFAFKKPAPQDPVRTNQIPRQIPDQIWYMSPTVSILMGGILPFGAIFIELYFILSALWDNTFYYIFGFLFVVLLILIVTSAEITIVMCYFQLCAEDYHWWWRSYLTSGASALFMFLYSILFFRRLEISKFVSIMLYFGYSFIMALGFFVMTGAIGYYSCFYFVRKIYSSIHIN